MGLIYRESVRDSDAGHRHADRGRACERFQMRGMMPNRTALQCKTTLLPSYQVDGVTLYRQKSRLEIGGFSYA